ncbi:hypothetical protein [Sphingomonas sp. 22R3R2A-7]|uniref:hypothetical protein n=1 Tax=Sphingomonas sp. 22R3R2A-7 TaxID=3050230 RepID=UPI002FE0038F
MTVFACEGGPPWRYSVAVPCPAPAAPIVAAIAAARITTVAKDYGANSACMYPRPGVSGNFWATRAMDCVLFRVEKPNVWDQLPRTVQDFRIEASREGVTTQPRSSKTSAYTPINNVTLQRFAITSRKRGIFIRNGSSNWVVQDFRITGSGINTSPGDIPGGIVMDGAHNITIRRGEVSGFKTVLADPKKYANADCIAAERGDSFTATDLYLHDCTDGGIDTKATTTLDRIRVANIGHYSYRFWALATVGTLTSENPGGAHIQIAAASTDVTIAKLIAIGPRAIVHVDNKGIGGKVTIKECDLSKWTGTALLSGLYTRARITLGKGCAR